MRWNLSLLVRVQILKTIKMTLIYKYESEKSTERCIYLRRESKER